MSARCPHAANIVTHILAHVVRRPVRHNRKWQAASVWRRCNSGASHIGRSRGTKTRAVRFPEGVDAPELREARMLLSGG